MPWRCLEHIGFAASLKEGVNRVVGKIPPEFRFEFRLMDCKCTLALLIFKELAVGVQWFGAELLEDDPAAILPL